MMRHPTPLNSPLVLEPKEPGGDPDGPALHDQRGNHQDEDAGEKALVAARVS
jgi:hypothetical protein